MSQESDAAMREMIGSSFNSITNAMMSFHIRISALENRIGAIEGKLNGGLREAIHDVISNDIGANRVIKSMVENHLEEYDPTDYHGFERAVESVVDQYPMGERIKEVIKDDLSFEVTVR